MHHTDFDHEGSQDFSHIFQEMATSAGLMDSEFHEVQEVLPGWKDLWAVHCVVKGSPKGIQFFSGDASHWITQDHRTKGDPFPQSSLLASGTILQSVVKKSRAEWGHISQPSADKPLPPGPHLQPVAEVLYNQCQHYASPLTIV